MSNDNEFIIRAKEILAGSETKPSDISDFECFIGESMCDSNNWNGNPFTLFGFACAIEKFHPIAEATQEEINDRIRNKMNIHLVDVLTLEVMQEQDWDDDDNLYYQFVSTVVNMIPSYKTRWFSELKEQIQNYE
jgi:hypothetical protein